jgi:hypothetical protein
MAPTAPATIPPTQLPTPPANKEADWNKAETEFFEKHGITEDKEKEIIRRRATVNLYAERRKKFDEEAATPPPPEPGKKKFWEDD